MPGTVEGRARRGATVGGSGYTGPRREPETAEEDRRLRVQGRSGARTRTITSFAGPHDPEQYRAAMLAARLRVMKDILTKGLTKRFHELLGEGMSPQEAIAELDGAAKGEDDA